MRFQISGFFGKMHEMNFRKVYIQKFQFSWPCHSIQATLAPFSMECRGAMILQLFALVTTTIITTGVLCMITCLVDRRSERPALKETQCVQILNDLDFNVFQFLKFMGNLSCHTGQSCLICPIDQIPGYSIFPLSSWHH